MKLPRLRLRHFDNRIPERFQGESEQDYRKRLIRTAWLTPRESEKLRRYEESEWGKPVTEFSGRELRQMGRREFVKYAGIVGAVSGLTGFAIGDHIGMVRALSAPTTGFTMEPGSMQTPAGYVIYQDDSTILARSGKTGANEKSGTDYGDVFNYCRGQFPTRVDPLNGGVNPGGGLIFTKASPSAYVYTTTPLINTSYVRAMGEGVGTVLQPGAAVDGMTVAPPTGGMLAGVEVSDFQFGDPNANGVGKAYLKIDCALNGKQLTGGLFTRLLFEGGLAGGQTGKGIVVTGTQTPAAYAWYTFFREILFYNYWSDSHLTVGYHTDLHFDDIIVSLNISTAYATANPVYNFTTSVEAATGSRLRRWKVPSGTGLLAGMVLLHLDNMNTLQLYDLWLDLPATSPAITVLKLSRAATKALRIYDSNIFGGLGSSVGIEFAADAAADFSEQFGDGAFFYDCYVRGCGTGVKSNAGDASTKTFIRGGLFGNTTNFSPNPLTNARFWLTRISGVMSQGWGVTTPALPVGIGSANAVQNNTGFTVLVNMAGPSGTRIIDENNNDQLLSADSNMVILPPKAKIYFATTVPSAWKWFAFI